MGSSAFLPIPKTTLADIGDELRGIFGDFYFPPTVTLIAGALAPMSLPDTVPAMIRVTLSMAMIVLGFLCGVLWIWRIEHLQYSKLKRMLRFGGSIGLLAVACLVSGIVLAQYRSLSSAGKTIESKSSESNDIPRSKSEPTTGPDRATVSQSVTASQPSLGSIKFQSSGTIRDIYQISFDRIDQTNLGLIDFYGKEMYGVKATVDLTNIGIHKQPIKKRCIVTIGTNAQIINVQIKELDGKMYGQMPGIYAPYVEWVIPCDRGVNFFLYANEPIEAKSVSVRTM